MKNPEAYIDSFPAPYFILGMTGMRSWAVLQTSFRSEGVRCLAVSFYKGSAQMSKISLANSGRITIFSRGS